MASTQESARTETEWSLPFCQHAFCRVPGNLPLLEGGTIAERIAVRIAVGNKLVMTMPIASQLPVQGVCFVN